MLYLTNPGSGDTTSSQVLELSTAPPVAGSVPNYDTNRDEEPGLTISAGDGVTESDPTKRQYWTYMLGAADLTGTAVVELDVAVEDFDSDDSGEIEVRLRRCNAGLSSCATLGTATGNFAQGGGSFNDVVINVALSGGTTAAQPVLQLIVATTEDSDEDLWYAYDTAAENSSVTVTIN